MIRNTITVCDECPMCGKTSELDVDREHYRDYLSGVLVQDAFPELNPREREFLKLGYCPDCQEAMTGTEMKTRIRPYSPL